MTAVAWAWVEERLAGARNYFLAVNRSGAAPYVRPVWCVWDGGALLFTSSASSAKARAFTADPRVSVHLELEREVVVVEGTVEAADPEAALVDAYGAKYGWTPPPSQHWYRVRARHVYAADEATYPESAATFRL